MKCQVNLLELDENEDWPLMKYIKETIFKFIIEIKCI